MTEFIDLDSIKQECDRVTDATAGLWFGVILPPDIVRALVAVVRAELAQDALLASPNVSLSAWQKINADRRAALVPFQKEAR